MAELIGIISTTEKTASAAIASGARGKSAYEIWLDEGNTGTVDEYLASLIGATGPQGEIGPKGDPGEVTQAEFDAHKNDYTTEMANVVSYEPGLNKFNKSDTTIVSGQFVSYLDGAEIFKANASYGVTHYIPIKPNVRYLNSSISNFKTNIFYDKNKNVIGKTSNNDFTVTNLDNVAYVRCNFNLSELNTLMIYEYDGIAKPYESFKLLPFLNNDLTIKPDRVDLISKANEPLANYKKAYKSLVDGENKIYNISVIGDSISSGAVAGTNNDDHYKFSYLGLIRSKFAEIFDDTGYGLMPSFHLAPQQKFITTGTWGTSPIGVGQLSWTTSEQSATVSFEFSGNGIAIMVHGSPTKGTVGVSIDGGTQQIINLAYSTAQIKFEKIEGLVDGLHTCVITNLEAKEFIFIGAYEIKGSKGFRVNFCGRSGKATPEYSASNDVMFAEIDIFEPILTILASITNDIGLSLDINTYRTNLQTLVTRAKQYGDVILLANNGRVDKSNAIQLPYVNAMKDIAIKNNCLFVDMYRRWDREATNMSFMADTLHMNAAGHNDIAKTLESELFQ